MKNALKAIGLNDNEIKVYIALLQTGLTQAGALIQETKLHRMLVYTALESLKNRDLIQVTQKKRIKLFEAREAKVLLEKASSIVEGVKSVLPDLEKLQGKGGDAVNVRTLVGQEGFITNLQEIAESAAKQKNKRVSIIGGAKDSDFYEAIGEWYPSYLKLLKKKGVKKFLLAPRSYSSEFKKNFVVEEGAELRTLPVGLSSPTYTRITHEMVSIEIYKPKIVVIQIKNAAVAQAYLDSFELLWKAQRA